MIIRVKFGKQKTNLAVNNTTIFSTTYTLGPFTKLVQTLIVS